MFYKVALAIVYSLWFAEKFQAWAATQNDVAIYSFTMILVFLWCVALHALIMWLLGGEWKRTRVKVKNDQPSYIIRPSEISTEGYTLNVYYPDGVGGFKSVGYPEEHPSIEEATYAYLRAEKGRTKHLPVQIIPRRSEPVKRAA